MSMFTAAMKMCDDCSRNDRPLRWWGDYIRICDECRAARAGQAPRLMPDRDPALEDAIKAVAPDRTNHE